MAGCTPVEASARRATVSTKSAPVLDTKVRHRTPDDLWLTKRCQDIVNRMNSGLITKEQAVNELKVVGNTQEQSLRIVELHAGRDVIPVKFTKRDPLRPARR